MDGLLDKRSYNEGLSAGTAPLRTGAAFLASIAADGRRVFIDGELVQDVTTHPAFRGAAHSIAGLYDFAADPANAALMTYASPTDGRPCCAASRSRAATPTSAPSAWLRRPGRS